MCIFPKDVHVLNIGTHTRDLGLRHATYSRLFTASFSLLVYWISFHASFFSCHMLESLTRLLSEHQAAPTPIQKVEGLHNFCLHKSSSVKGQGETATGKCVGNGKRALFVCFLLFFDYITAILFRPYLLCVPPFNSL